jgi:hypothetical protein
MCFSFQFSYDQTYGQNCSSVNGQGSLVRSQTAPRLPAASRSRWRIEGNFPSILAAHFRRLGVPVVMGGIHANMCCDEVMDRVDSIVTGEAEPMWPQVLEDARPGNLKRRYDGENYPCTPQSIAFYRSPYFFISSSVRVLLRACCFPGFLIG